VVEILRRKKRCREDRDRTVSSRIIQLGAVDHHYEKKIPIVFQGDGQRSRSYQYFVEKPCRWYKDRTVNSMIIQLNAIDHYHERKNPIVYKGQKSKVKVIPLLMRKTLCAG
jgi:hypothetical protein